MLYLVTKFRFTLGALFALISFSHADTGGEVHYRPIVSSYERLSPLKKGGVLNTYMYGNPKVMNPLLAWDGNSGKLTGYLWLNLMSEDEDTLEMLPGLAKSYTVSADRKSYTFFLQPQAVWEDGTSVTTEDVKFTFDKMMDVKTECAPLRSYYEGVQIHVKDSRTFTFTVQNPKFDTLRNLGYFSIINKKQFENDPDINKSPGMLRPIGYGPYKLKLFQRDQRIELERKKDWWGYSVPNLKNQFNFDKIVFRMIADPNLRYERFLRGDIDVLDFDDSGVELFHQKVLGIDKDRVGRSPKDGKEVWAGEFETKAPRPFSYVGWNLRNPIFASKKVRFALAHLTDIRTIIDKIYYGHYIQSTSSFGSLSLNANPSLRTPEKMIQYNLKKALELLKEDGWTDSNGDNILDKMINGKRVDFKFTLKYNDDPARMRVAQILKENFKKAGIEMEIRQVEWNAFLDDLNQHQFDAVLSGWSGASEFPNAKQMWHSSSAENQGSNYVGYHNPKVDALIEKSNLELDSKKRLKMIQEIDRLIYEDQPYLFLVEPKSVLAGFNRRMKASVWMMKYDSSPPLYLYGVE